MTQVLFRMSGATKKKDKLIPDRLANEGLFNANFFHCPLGGTAQLGVVVDVVVSYVNAIVVVFTFKTALTKRWMD